MQTVGDLVRTMENDYVRGDTQISKHVSFSMHETLEKIDAYLNSVHTSGKEDSLGREKPFFNISTAAVNVWYRATDIDRRHIQIRATKTSDWLNSFVATVVLRDWMRRTGFGQFLNEWGRVLARYGSAVLKFVEKDGRLHMQVVPWNRLIVDSVDFDANPKIEIIELTEAQLRERIETHGYDPSQVESLVEAASSRETLGKKKKDNKSHYIKLYEIHGKMSKFMLTGKEGDKTTFVQQMHVLSFVGVKNNGRTEHKDFTLFSGEEATDPYEITHLIKEDGRSLSIGAVEHLFQAQWMMNHSMKQIKDSLDLASKILFQTPDIQFGGRNALTQMETGDILFHAPNQPLTQINNEARDVVSWQNYATQWKQLGNEVNSISDAMLGAEPKSGTAWRQTEALLEESHSLFELMTENKALQLEEILRTRIIPNLKKQLNTKDEVSSILEQHEIDKIDSMYIRKESRKRVNKKIADKLLSGEVVTRQQQEVMEQEQQEGLQESLQRLGNKRFFKPSELDDKTWKEQFADIEWELDIDITGESFNAREALTTLNTALQLVVQPGFEENKKAQNIVGRILELTGTMSPVEYNSIPSPVRPQQAKAPKVEQNLPEDKQRNVNK